MFKMKYKIDKENIKLLSEMSPIKIKEYDFIKGNIFFNTPEKIYNISGLNPDALLSWINFLPIDENDIKEGYKEDVWGTNYWITYNKENIFMVSSGYDTIFKIQIKPSELINVFKIFYLDLKDQLIKINPAFKNNKSIQEIDKSYNI